MKYVIYFLVWLVLCILRLIWEFKTLPLDMSDSKEDHGDIVY